MLGSLRVVTLGHAASLGKWVLFIASSWLAHKPPVPQMTTATPEMAKWLIDGPNPTKPRWRPGSTG